jgi:hypothetical protein
MFHHHIYAKRSEEIKVSRVEEKIIACNISVGKQLGDHLEDLSVDSIKMDLKDVGLAVD